MGERFTRTVSGFSSNPALGKTKLGARWRRVDSWLGICVSFLAAVWAPLASAFVSSGLHLLYGEKYRMCSADSTKVVIRDHVLPPLEPHLLCAIAEVRGN